MTKLRDAIDDKAVSKNTWFSWAQNLTSTAFAGTLSWAQTGYAYGKVVGWFVVTTGLITILPLIFEVKREAQFEDAERAQIAAALQEGRTPQELAMSGLTAAVEPAVLK